MNHQKHPKALLTLIQNSEGAFFSKKWIFFKEFLSLEIDVRSHTKWRDNVNLKNLNNVKKENSKTHGNL
jgi:hypothetical protein